jgi:hypothetical protein
MLCKSIVNLFYFIFFTVLVLNSSCATRGKYETADVEIDPGYNNPGVIKLSVDLVKPSGRRKHLKAGTNPIKWSRLQFSGKNVLSESQGYLHYGMKGLTKENHLLKVNIYSEKYGFQKAFSVNVPFVKGIQVKTSKIELNTKNVFDYNLILSTDQHISKNENHFSLDSVELKSNVGLKFENGFLVLKSDFPLIDVIPQLILLNKLKKDTLWKSNLEIVYPSEKTYNHSGISGVSGRSGSNASNPSQSGDNGSNGGNGVNANDVYVFAQYYAKNNIEFVILTVESSGVREVSFLPKNSARVSIYVNGGNGGNGGRGGDGKDAAYPVTTTKNGKTTTTQPSVYGGNAGSGGDGGNGGRGGNVYVYLDDKLTDFRNSIHIENRGGVAGVGGVAGNAGRGMNSNGKLGGIFNSNNGKNSSAGRNGQVGQDGRVEGPILMTSEEMVKRFSFLKRL